MRTMKRITYNIVATAVLPLWLLTQVVTCGPRDSREPTRQQKSPRSRTAPNQDPPERCLARVRCYRSIVSHQIAAVNTVHLTLSEMCKVQMQDMNPKTRAQAAALQEAAQVRAATLSGQLKDLAQPQPPATSAACKTARTRLLRAISLLKAEYAYLIRQVVGLVVNQLKDPDKDVRKMAQLALDSLKKEMRRTKQKLTGLKVCQPFARRK